jgi:hypothetical protein
MLYTRGKELGVLVCGSGVRIRPLISAINGLDFILAMDKLGSVKFRDKTRTIENTYDGSDSAH